jgi:hypothetical protein
MFYLLLCKIPRISQNACEVFASNSSAAKTGLIDNKILLKPGETPTPDDPDTKHGLYEDQREVSFFWLLLVILLVEEVVQDQTCPAVATPGSPAHRSSKPICEVKSLGRSWA